MARHDLSVEELVKAAARGIPELWTADGALNRSALGRYFKKQGRPLTQATFSRLLREKNRLSADTIDALHAVLKIPKAMLRGEPMNRDLDAAIERYGLTTFFTAERLERLSDIDPTAYKQVCGQINFFLERAEQKRKNMPSNVSSIERRLD